MKLTKLYFSVVILLCTVGEVVAQTQQIIIGNVTELFGKSTEPLICLLYTSPSPRDCS